MKRTLNDRIRIALPIFALLRILATVLLIGCLPKKTKAQERPLVWDLQTCIQYAKDHNITLLRTQLNKNNTEQDLILSRGARLPDLSVSATQFVTHANSAIGGLPKLYASGDYGANSSMILYKGGYLNYDIKQKMMHMASAELSVQEQQNQVTVQIMQYYLNTLLNKETVTYRRTVVTTSLAQVSRAKEQLAVGSIEKKDLLQLEAQLANDRYSLMMAENATKQDIIQLKQLLQLPISAVLDIVAIDTTTDIPLPDKPQQVGDMAYRYRPEVSNGVLGINIARAELDKAKTGYLPTLSASGYLGTRYLAGSTGYFKQLTDNFSRQLGLTLSVPIFTRKYNSVQVAKAKIGIKQAELDLTETKTTLSLAIERIYNDLITAIDQLRSAAEAIKFNNEIYRVALEQLQTGLINMVDYLQQKNLYIQAQQQFLQAKYQAALTYRIYNFYKGEQAQ